VLVVGQPSGTVTLVFTDIEGSTRLLHELGQTVYREALAEHRRVVREAFARADGYEVDYEGDAFFYAFASAQAAVDSVAEAIRGLECGPVRVRVGIHTGEPDLDPPKYVGVDVHKAARIMSRAMVGRYCSPNRRASWSPSRRRIWASIGSRTSRSWSGSSSSGTLRSRR
jgi:class 3 adenylate cyclase